MGNRAQLILTKEHEGDMKNQQDIFIEYSPTIYLHWNGSPDSVLTMVDKLSEVMHDRKGDLEYATARLIGLYHNFIDGNLSLGVSSNSGDEDLILNQSPGDNGTYFICCDTFEVIQHSYEGITHYESKKV